MKITTRDEWSAKIKALENKVTEMKKEACEGMPDRPTGSHPIVNGLAAIEALAWGLYDAVSRFPVDEEIKSDQQLGLL